MTYKLEISGEADEDIFEAYTKTQQKILRCSVVHNMHYFAPKNR
jgi:hypothetical protein